LSSQKIDRLSSVRGSVAVGSLAVLFSLLVMGPARAEKDLTVKLPAAGEYLVWVEAHSATGTQAQAPVTVNGDRAALTLAAPPTGLHEWLVLALDQKTGYVAAKTLPTKETPSTASFATSDFNRVHRVRVQVTGAGGKPVANASVTLTDSSGLSLSKVIDPTAAGSAEFADVPSGGGKLVVTTGGGKSTSKDVDVNLPKGETVQAINVPLPEVTAVVEPPPAATAGTPSSNTPATTSAPAEGKDSGAPTSSETKSGGEGKGSPLETPTAQAPSGGSGIGTLVGLIVIFAVCYLVYLRARNQGWTLDKGLAQLGVQPVTPPPTGTGSPAPPPTPVDPNVCAFCGQRKDPLTGACACSLDAALAGGGLGPAPGLGGSGPRLVAVGGVAMGQIFPVAGQTSIGRDPGNGVPLAMDTTVSRRHAVIAAEDGSYVIRDQGSSNGTFVNGARVTESPLSPGDEVSIGGTRFRFEA
jgi:hypothetical protein